MPQQSNADTQHHSLTPGPRGCQTTLLFLTLIINPYRTNSLAMGLRCSARRPHPHSLTPEMRGCRLPLLPCVRTKPPIRAAAAHACKDGPQGYQDAESRLLRCRSAAPRAPPHAAIPTTACPCIRTCRHPVLRATPPSLFSPCVLAPFAIPTRPLRPGMLPRSP